MTEVLLAAVQWLGLILFLFGACAIVTCAAQEMHDVPGRFGPVTTHDWDALDGARENRRQRD